MAHHSHWMVEREARGVLDDVDVAAEVARDDVGRFDVGAAAEGRIAAGEARVRPLGGADAGEEGGHARLVPLLAVHHALAAERAQRHPVAVVERSDVLLSEGFPLRLPLGLRALLEREAVADVDREELAAAPHDVPRRRVLEDGEREEHEHEHLPRAVERGRRVLAVER